MLEIEKPKVECVEISDDGKYGKLKEDKKLGFSKQALYSYKLTFKFTEDADILNYLNNKTFSVNSVWFAEQIFGYKR